MGCSRGGDRERPALIYAKVRRRADDSASIRRYTMGVSEYNHSVKEVPP